MFKSRIIKKSLLLIIVASFFHISFVEAKIITSVKPIGFITAAIADGITETEVLLPDGASPHIYSLKPSDLVKLRTAELIVWIGDDMETFLPNLLKKIDEKKQIKLTSYNSIDRLLIKNTSHNETQHDDHTDHHGEYDTHIWLSPEIALITAQIIHDKLNEIYPEKASKIDENLNNFIFHLKEIKQIIAKKLNNVQNTNYFVFHDAYSYFETEFHLNKLGSFTINPSIQLGFKTIYDIQNELKDKKAVCIFKEPQLNTAVINKLVEGTNVKIGELDPLGMDIAISKDAYCKFLLNMTQQYLNCLE